MRERLIDLKGATVTLRRPMQTKGGTKFELGEPLTVRSVARGGGAGRFSLESADGLRFIRCVRRDDFIVVSDLRNP